MAQPIESVATACTDLEADLVLFHYGDLDGGERERLQAHLANCAGCSNYLKELTTLMPLTVKTDTPPHEFWMDYSRELRHKIDAAVDHKPWWQNLTAIFQPRYLSALAAAAVLAMALTFTLNRGLWNGKNDLPDDELSEALPVAENLEFFRAMDVLDNLDLLEAMDNSANDAA
jgi:hypothetical protein